MDTAATIEKLGVGQHIVRATYETATCIFTDTITIANDTVAPTISYTKTNVTTAGGSNGSIEITNTTGAEPFTYVWAPVPAEVNIPINITNPTNLPKGDYTVTVTDALGCEVEETITLTDYVQFAFAAQVLKPSCFQQNDGAIEVTEITDGSGTFTLSLHHAVAGSAATQVGNTITWPAATFTNLAVGNYVVVVDDNVTRDTSAVLTVIEAPAINLSVVAIPATPVQYGQLVVVKATASNTPLAYEWSANPTAPMSFIDGDSIVMFTAQATTTVTATVTNALGCEEMSAVEVVVQDCPSLQDAEDVVNNNTYSVVGLVNLCWFRENFKGTLYADGTPIPFAEGYEYSQASPADENIANFGRLYTYEAATRMQNTTTFTQVTPENTSANAAVQGVCPRGWRLPNAAEWQRLSATYAATELRSTDFWKEPNQNTNTTTFSSRPAGLYNETLDRFEKLYVYTAYWSSTSNLNASQVYVAEMKQYCDVLEVETMQSNVALSVRCVATIPLTVNAVVATRSADGTTATLISVVSPGDQTIASVTVEYQTAGGAWNAIPASQVTIENGAYKASLTGLTTGTAYEFRTVVAVEGETENVISNTVQF